MNVKKKCEQFLLDLFFSGRVPKSMHERIVAVLTPGYCRLFEQVIGTIEIERTREVLQRRYGFAGYTPHTYKELAGVFGRSQSLMREILTKQMRTMRTDNRFYRLAVRLYTNGVTEGDHTHLAQHGVSPEDLRQLQRDQPDELRALSVDVLGLSIRARMCLKNENLQTLGDVQKKTSGELLRAPNMGRKSLNEVRAALAQFGLTLKDDTGR